MQQMCQEQCKKCKSFWIKSLCSTGLSYQWEVAKFEITQQWSLSFNVNMKCCSAHSLDIHLPSGPQPPSAFSFPPPCLSHPHSKREPTPNHNIAWTSCFPLIEVTSHTNFTLGWYQLHLCRHWYLDFTAVEQWYLCPQKTAQQITLKSGKIRSHKSHWFNKMDHSPWKTFFCRKDKGWMLDTGLWVHNIPTAKLTPTRHRLDWTSTSQRKLCLIQRSNARKVSLSTAAKPDISYMLSGVGTLTLTLLLQDVPELRAISQLRWAREGTDETIQQKQTAQVQRANEMSGNWDTLFPPQLLFTRVWHM